MISLQETAHQKKDEEEIKMNHMTLALRLLILLGAVMLLLGCNQVEEAKVLPTDTPLPPTHTEALPTDTPVPPTDTPIPSTETPTPTPIPPTETPTPTPIPPTETPTPEPTKDLPEYPVTAWEDLVGTWKPETYRSNTVRYKADGVAQLRDHNGQVVETDICNVEAGVLSCSSDNCAKADAKTGTVTLFTCIGEYRVFITMDGEFPVRLRYELIEDQNDIRAGMLTLGPWVWVEE